MKRVLMKCLKCICFVGIFALLFFGAQELLRGKWIIGGKDNTASTSSFKEYRELSPDTVDVLFVGTSHVLYGIDPMYLYQETGITSYVFGGPGLRLDLSYLTLKEVLDTQSPKIVFLDASGLHYEKQQTEAKAHKFADQLPLTWEKIEYAFNNGNDELDPLGVMFPLFRYHSRWDKLEKNDLRYVTGTLEETYMRGHFASYEQVPATLSFESEEKFTITDRNLDYFERIVKLCKQEGVELVLYKIPTPDWNRSYSDAAAAVALEQGVPFWELTNELDKIGIDPQVDYHDATDHLNQYGAEKLTAYMGEVLTADDRLTDQRGSNEKWDADLLLYQDRLKALKAEYEQQKREEKQETEQQMQAEQEEEE